MLELSVRLVIGCIIMHAVLFHDFLPPSSVKDMMTMPYEAGADGMLLWGHPDGESLSDGPSLPLLCPPLSHRVSDLYLLPCMSCGTSMPIC